jgi:uncharacterized membrane protein YuzA (DUF378 family)
MKLLHQVAFILVIIGGLNWLLVGLFGFDIGTFLGGQSAIVSRLIYILVGLAAVAEIVKHKQNCKMCTMPVTTPMQSSQQK